MKKLYMKNWMVRKSFFQGVKVAEDMVLAKLKTSSTHIGKSTEKAVSILHETFGVRASVETMWFPKSGCVVVEEGDLAGYLEACKFENSAKELEKVNEYLKTVKATTFAEAVESAKFDQSLYGAY